MIVLMAGSRKELGELTELTDTTSAAYGMAVSTEKSKIMVIATEKTQPEIKIRGKKNSRAGRVLQILRNSDYKRRKVRYGDKI